VYLGAYVRHVEADRACQGWPLCNGQVVPTLRGPILYNFVHRGAAGLLALAIAALCIWAWHLRGERPDIFRGAIIALALVVLQSLSGAIIVWTHADLLSALLHAGLVGLMFAGLTYICMHLLPRPSTVTETAPEVLRPRIAPGIQSPHA
jgi:cytochrome c oxidase assembly protein subunit 15